MKNVSTVLLDYVYAVIYLYRGERLCNIMHYLKVQRTILGVANGKIRDSPRRRDPSQKSEPETFW